MHISIYITVLITSLQTSYARYGVYCNNANIGLQILQLFKVYDFLLFLFIENRKKLGSGISSVITGDSRQILFYAWK